MFPSCFNFNLFSLHFLSGHKQLNIFFLNIDIFQKHILFFNRFQKQSFLLNIFSEAATCSLKNIEMFLEATTHLLQHKKYRLHIFFQKHSHNFFSQFLHKTYSEAAAHFHSRFLHKIYSEAAAQNVLKIFHNLFQ